MDNLEMKVNNENQSIKKQGLFGRVSGIIASPTETMKSLIEKPRVLFPIISIAFATLLLYLIRYPLFQDFIRQALVNAKTSPEQFEAALNMGSKIGLIFAPLGSLLQWCIVTFLIIGIAKLMKGKGSIKQYFSVTGYAYVIAVLYLLLSLIVSYFSGELHLNSSLALLVPGMKGSFIYGLLRGIDLFTLWQYAVIAIGVKQLSELKGIKIYIMLSVIYIGFILVSVSSLKYM